MNDTKLKTWILWAVVLFLLSLTVDYFFLHLLFDKDAKSAQIETTPVPTESVNLEGPAEPVDVEDLSQPTDQIPPAGDGNFLNELKKCLPEIAAQAIATPEAFVEYLQKSVGAAKEKITLENYDITLPDGSLRRIQVLSADTTRSAEKHGLRLFSIDKEGHQEALALQDSDTKESLLQMGKLNRHSIKSEIELGDRSRLLLEKWDNRIAEFQFSDQAKNLSCQQTTCKCTFLK